MIGDWESFCNGLFCNLDEETREHSIRVGKMCAQFTALLQKEGLQVPTDESIYRNHDIGKLQIPAGVLLKEKKLTDMQFQLIKQHTGKGYVLLTGGYQGVWTSVCRATLDVVLMHHENFDGGGYPLGLAGDEIPIAARVCRIVDSYDAMVHRRCYKEGIDRECVLSELTTGAGRQYDPELAQKFRRFIECSGGFL